MKSVILAIGKVEIYRLKTRLWLLFVLLLGFSATIGCQEGVDFSKLDFSKVDVDISTHSSGANTTQEDLIGLNYQKLFAVAPLIGAAATCLGLGFLVLLTMPFRSGEDRRLGCLQLMWLSNPSFPRIEAIRYGVYFIIGSLFFITVLTIGIIYGNSKNLIPMATAVEGSLVLAFWFFSALALAIAFGGFITSLNNTYANALPGWPIKLLINLGILGALLNILDSIAHTLSMSSWSILPIFELPVGDPLTYELKCPLPLDWWLITLCLTALLVAWTGRIYDEMEI